MKILFPLGAFFPSQIGGPCNTLYWHTCALNSNKVKTTVLTSDRGIGINQVNRDRWENSKCGKVYYSSLSIKLILKSFLELIKELQKNEIIHLNSLFSYYSIFSFFYVRFFLGEKKIIWSVRGELNSNALHFSKWKKVPLLFLFKKFNKEIIYHSTSPEESSSIKKVFPKSRFIELPNFIEPAEREKEEVLSHFVFVGRIHPIKSIHKLIESLAISKTFRSSDFKLLIVGKHEKRHSDYRNYLDDLIMENDLMQRIEFTGHITGKEKERILSRSYALILPSETENFGNVVLEALNQGTPVIASNGTPWGILERFNAGYHVSNKPVELAKAIERIMNLEKKEYELMRLNSVKIVDENYNVNTQINKWINIYEEILYEN